MQKTYSLWFIILFTSSAFATPHLAKSWAQSHPSWYSAGYMHTNVALSTLAGYTYIKLCASHLLEKQWSDSLSGILDFFNDMKQSHNYVHVAASVTALLTMSALIHKSKWGKAFDEIGDKSKRTGLLSILATSVIGCSLKRYLSS